MGVAMERTLRAFGRQAACYFLDLMVIPEGLEPPTPCLEGRCSILLSYGTKFAGAYPVGEARQDVAGEG